VFLQQHFHMERFSYLETFQLPRAWYQNCTLLDKTLEFQYLIFSLSLSS